MDTNSECRTLFFSSGFGFQKIMRELSEFLLCTQEKKVEEVGETGQRNIKKSNLKPTSIKYNGLEL